MVILILNYWNGPCSLRAFFDPWAWPHLAGVIRGHRLTPEWTGAKVDDLLRQLTRSIVNIMVLSLQTTIICITLELITVGNAMVPWIYLSVE